MPTCPSDNANQIDQTSFWDHGHINWDAHRIGWAVAGGTTALTAIITLTHMVLHLMNYNKPNEQRQVVRILLMPLVYGIVSFFSYRFFRSYTYYYLAETVYEAVTLAAFMMLMIIYVGDTSNKQHDVLAKKGKKKIPFPFCFWRMRPEKPYWLVFLKWSVLQYCLFRPLISIAGIICQAYNVLCPEKYSIHFAEVYLDVFDFVSITIALEGLIVFYAVVKEDLKGKKPLSKFLCIKGIVFFTFYQGFLFSILQDHGVIKDTKYWTATNVANGLNALCTCSEMVIFSICMFFAFTYKEYTNIPEAKGHTNVFLAFLHSQNYWDFLKEGWYICKFGVDRIRGKSYTHHTPEAKANGETSASGQLDIVHAFRKQQYPTGYFDEEARTPMIETGDAPSNWPAAPDESRPWGKSEDAMIAAPEEIPEVDHGEAPRRTFAPTSFGKEGMELGTTRY